MIYVRTEDHRMVEALDVIVDMVYQNCGPLNADNADYTGRRMHSGYLGAHADAIRFLIRYKRMHSARDGRGRDVEATFYDLFTISHRRRDEKSR